MGYGAISGKDLKSGCINNGAQSLDNCENGLLSSEGVGKRVHVSYSNQWIKVSDGSGASPEFHDSNSDLKSLDRSASDINYQQYIFQQVTAIFLACMLNFMISIPFGVSYFPVEWKSVANVNEENDIVSGETGGVFPLPGKEALGIRMFLFSTVIGQLVFTFFSGFKNAIGLQMVENVPFCHSLALICIREQGYGIEALSTLMFLFGLASVVVGIVFFFLGYFEFGRIVYFFPSHVLIGCIGGIGYFVLKVALEVTMNDNFSLSLQGLHLLLDNMDLIGVVLLFEVTLRALTRFTKEDGKAKYPLLAPIYYCAITPIFYCGLFFMGITMEKAQEKGYFFPSLTGCDPTESNCSNGMVSSLFDDHLFDIFKLVNFNTINWTAVVKSIPTMISLTAFSLIHVPINIPAFSISSGVDADMNKELKAHGYSNAIAGLFGGLQNYLCYSNSVLYFQTKGEGIWSGLSVAFLSAMLYFFGPSIASYIPRCMAGTLLMHVGIDLIIEGVYDSYGKFDNLEYAGIWAIALVMSMYGMSAALVAGIIAALSVYAVQSITHQNPVRGAMSAKTLRSSRLNRPPGAKAILDSDEFGRRKIFVIQLQGHIFFGNVVLLTERIKTLLYEKRANHDALIVILDFTLVLGIDSSAAHAISKLKEQMRRKFNVSLTIFVTGSNDGFPCSFDLTHDIAKDAAIHTDSSLCQANIDGSTVDRNVELGTENEPILKMKQSWTTSIRIPSSVSEGGRAYIPEIPAGTICSNLDEALTFAEDTLIALKDHNLLSSASGSQDLSFTREKGKMTVKEEYDVLFHYLSNLCHGEKETIIRELQSLFKRNTWKEGEIIWRQSSSSDSLHLLVQGKLLSVLEEEAGTTEIVNAGAMFGELGLITGIDRLSTVKVISSEAVTMSLEKDVWEEYVKGDVNLSRCLYMISIRYMSHRLQHVSNRIFETRCLPI